MFKRSTKLTALLVAAASVVSTVPAMAATRLATKEGTIDNAVAFKDGKYVYEGYRTDDDDNGVYYNAGSKDKKLDDVEELGSTFGTKFVTVSDGDDNYVLDLSTGKVTDEDTEEDLRDTAESKLQTKLKKTDRYDENGKDATIGDDDYLGKVPSLSYGETWYEYTATTAKAADAGKTAVGVTGYTDGSGKYIDCSYDANIYAYNGDKMVKIENVGDTERDVTLKSMETVKTLTQDDKYIYRIVKVELTGAKNVKGEELNEAYYVQKISKSQGDKEDDAYLPKSTDSYLIADEDTLKNGDVKDAYNVLYNEAKEDAKYYVVDNALYATFTDGDKVKTVKIVFKTSEKLDLYEKEDDEYEKTGHKVGFHVAKKDGDKDTDATAWAVDVKGNVWALDEGEIKKSTKVGDFDTVYTCDRSLDTLRVYDEKSLIAWEAGEDVYTNVSEGSAEAKKEAEEIAGVDETKKEDNKVVKAGWAEENGNWVLYNAQGAKVTGWTNAGGAWFFMDQTTGTMKTGWLQDGGNWYFLNPISDGTRGTMKTGWQYIGGVWYFFNANGTMKTGWLYSNGAWYFLNASGAMATNTTVGGYTLGANGAWVR